MKLEMELQAIINEVYSYCHTPRMHLLGLCCSYVQVSNYCEDSPTGEALLFEQERLHEEACVTLTQVQPVACMQMKVEHDSTEFHQYTDPMDSAITRALSAVEGIVFDLLTDNCETAGSEKASTGTPEAFISGQCATYL